jgi:hypothetical protein
MDPHSIPPEYTKPTNFEEVDMFINTPSDREVHATGAVRSTDANNVRYDLISPQALRRLAMTYDEGAKKYGAFNYKKGFQIQSLMNHAIRHCYLFLEGNTDEDHLPHAIWNLMTAIEMMETRPELDDRYVPNAEKTKFECPVKDEGCKKYNECPTRMECLTYCKKMK